MPARRPYGHPSSLTIIKPVNGWLLAICQELTLVPYLSFNHPQDLPDGKGEQMRRHDPRAWMLSEAIELLQTAGRLQRQFFQIGQNNGMPCWEPPIDMFGDDDELFILVALPGVAPGRFEVTLDQASIVVRGERALGAILGTGAIFHLEIPYGCFERRIDLPDGAYQMADMQLENGCLRLQLGRLK